MESTTNVFTDGLISDMHPLTTLETQLTDALNATFITNNGNEMMLLNDMGNTPIQDSTTGAIMQLSEGFVPVGMKEYGGILYIASLNNKGKGEIGTIPSPLIRTEFSLNNVAPEGEQKFLDIPTAETEKELALNTPAKTNVTFYDKFTPILLGDNYLKTGDKFCLVLPAPEGYSSSTPFYSTYDEYGNCNKDGWVNISLKAVRVTGEEIEIHPKPFAKGKWWITDESDRKMSTYIPYPNIPKGKLKIYLTLNLPKILLIENELTKRYEPFGYSYGSTPSTEIFIGGFSDEDSKSPIKITFIEIAKVSDNYQIKNGKDSISTDIDDYYPYPSEIDINKIRDDVYNEGDGRYEGLIFSNKDISDKSNLTLEAKLLLKIKLWDKSEHYLGYYNVKYNPNYIVPESVILVGSDAETQWYDATDPTANPYDDIESAITIKDPEIEKVYTMAITDNGSGNALECSLLGGAMYRSTTDHTSELFSTSEINLKFNYFFSNADDVFVDNQKSTIWDLLTKYSEESSELPYSCTDVGIKLSLLPSEKSSISNSILKDQVSKLGIIGSTATTYAGNVVNVKPASLSLWLDMFPTSDDGEYAKPFVLAVCLNSIADMGTVTDEKNQNQFFTGILSPTDQTDKDYLKTIKNNYGKKVEIYPFNKSLSESTFLYNASVQLASPYNPVGLFYVNDKDEFKYDLHKYDPITKVIDLYSEPVTSEYSINLTSDNAEDFINTLIKSIFGESTTFLSGCYFSNFLPEVKINAPRSGQSAYQVIPEYHKEDLDGNPVTLDGTPNDLDYENGWELNNVRLGYIPEETSEVEGRTILGDVYGNLDEYVLHKVGDPEAGLYALIINGLDYDLYIDGWQVENAPENLALYYVRPSKAVSVINIPEDYINKKIWLKAAKGSNNFYIRNAGLYYLGKSGEHNRIYEGKYYSVEKEKGKLYFKNSPGSDTLEDKYIFIPQAICFAEVFPDKRININSEFKLNPMTCLAKSYCFWHYSNSPHYITKYWWCFWDNTRKSVHGFSCTYNPNDLNKDKWISRDEELKTELILIKEDNTIK